MAMKPKALGKKSAATQERRLKAWELRKAGMSLRAIGRALGVCHVVVKRYLDKTSAELDEQQVAIAATQRKLALARLDDMMLRLQPMLNGKDPNRLMNAIEKVIRIEERRAKLMGLDSPTKVAPTDPTGEKPYDPGQEFTDEEAIKRAEAVVAFERARYERAKEAAQRVIPHQENGNGTGVDPAGGASDGGLPN